MRHEELEPIRLPEGVEVEHLDGAVPGKAGRVRLLYAGNPDLRGAAATEWVEVDQRTDRTHTLRLQSPRPDTARFCILSKRVPGRENLRLRFRFHDTQSKVGYEYVAQPWS